jgi:hypothetical protein
VTFSQSCLPSHPDRRPPRSRRAEGFDYYQNGLDQKAGRPVILWWLVHSQSVGLGARFSGRSPCITVACRLVPESRVRIGPETTLLLWKSTPLERKTGSRLAVGVSPRKPQVLAGILSVARSFSGATATGMAWQCRIGPEFPAVSGTRHLPAPSYWPEGFHLYNWIRCTQTVVCRGGRWTDTAAGSSRHCRRAGVLALKRPAPGQLLGWVLWSGRLWHDLRLKAAGGGGRCQGVRNSLTTP